MVSIRRIGAVTLLLLGGAGEASATTARLLTIERIAERAELVVVARVTRRHAEWHGMRIYTHHHLAVEETWYQGEPVESPVMISLGGVVGTIGQQVIGASQLSIGKRAVFLLAADDNDLYHAVGMWQGVFHLDDDRLSRSVFRPDVGVRLVGPVPTFPTTTEQLQSVVLEIKRAP